MPASKDVCTIDGGCGDDYTFYYIIAVVAVIIIGGLIFINYNKDKSNNNNDIKEDNHVHGECNGEKCYM